MYYVDPHIHMVSRTTDDYETLAKMEKRSFLESIITQNIDHLHQKAGNRYVYELHGTYKQLVCTECSSEFDMSFADLNYLPPTCYICKGILKPDMVFFNEPIPPPRVPTSVDSASEWAETDVARPCQGMRSPGSISSACRSCRSASSSRPPVSASAAWPASASTMRRRPSLAAVLPGCRSSTS